MFWLDGMVCCGDSVLRGSTQHLRMEAVGQRQGWSHHRAKTGEYEDASYSIHIYNIYSLYIYK